MSIFVTCQSPYLGFFQFLFLIGAFESRRLLRRQRKKLFIRMSFQIDLSIELKWQLIHHAATIPSKVNPTKPQARPTRTSGGGGGVAPFHAAVQQRGLLAPAARTWKSLHCTLPEPLSRGSSHSESKLMSCAAFVVTPCGFAYHCKTIPICRDEGVPQVTTLEGIFYHL